MYIVHACLVLRLNLIRTTSLTRIIVTHTSCPPPPGQFYPRCGAPGPRELRVHYRVIMRPLQARPNANITINNQSRRGTVLRLLSKFVFIRKNLGRPIHYIIILLNKIRTPRIKLRHYNDTYPMCIYPFSMVWC